MRQVLPFGFFPAPWQECSYHHTLFGIVRCERNPVLGEYIQRPFVRRNLEWFRNPRSPIWWKTSWFLQSNDRAKTPSIVGELVTKSNYLHDENVRKCNQSVLSLCFGLIASQVVKHFKNLNQNIILILMLILISKFKGLRKSKTPQTKALASTWLPYALGSHLCGARYPPKAWQRYKESFN